MAETRSCDRCGTVFVPRREHARFCSAGCRVAWNEENSGDPAAELSALGWSIGAMGDATERLARVRAWDPARAFGAVSEAVWWVTIVDATLVRYYPDAYDAELACQPGEERRLIEDTLGGLRFVRNQMGCGHVDFVRPPAGGGGSGADASGSGVDGGGSEAGLGGVTAWVWNPLPRPALSGPHSRGRAWEMRRYRAYRARLAGHSVGETFGRAAGFLRPTAAKAVPAGDAGAQPAP
jgi:hypothetical protein